MSDRIECDDEACEAVIDLGCEMNQVESVLRAQLEGWQSWLGTLRAYHRCPAHFAPNAAGLPQERSERLPRGTDPPIAPVANGEAVGDAMPNPHTFDCRNASCALEPAWTGEAIAEPDPTDPDTPLLTLLFPRAVTR